MSVMSVVFFVFEMLCLAVRTGGQTGVFLDFFFKNSCCDFFSPLVPNCAACCVRVRLVDLTVWPQNLESLSIPHTLLCLLSSSHHDEVLTLKVPHFKMWRSTSVPLCDLMRIHILFCFPKAERKVVLELTDSSSSENTWKKAKTVYGMSSFILVGKKNEASCFFDCIK